MLTRQTRSTENTRQTEKKQHGMYGKCTVLEAPGAASETTRQTQMVFFLNACLAMGLDVQTNLGILGLLCVGYHVRSKLV